MQTIMVYVALWGTAFLTLTAYLLGLDEVNR